MNLSFLSIYSPNLEEKSRRKKERSSIFSRKKKDKNGKISKSVPLKFKRVFMHNDDIHIYISSIQEVK